MKTVFLTGKGGVGKSTLAAALAWQLASRERRVLAVSLDPAHNLGDLFGVTIGDGGVDYSEHLTLREADVEAAARRSLKQSMDLLRETYRYAGALQLDRAFDVLKFSPGVEEYAALVLLESVFRQERDRDVVVFDTPPTGLTLRILALPQVALMWIERLVRVRRQILDKRHTIRRIAADEIGTGFEHLAYREDDDRVMQKLTELGDRYARLREALCGGDNAIGVVFNPDELSWHESRRLVEGLRSLRMPVRLAFSNRVTDDDSDRAERNEARMRELLGDVPILRVRREEGAMPGPQDIAEDLTGCVP